MDKILLFIRSTIFNLLFYGVTLFFCVLLLPLTFLPRRQMMGAVWIFVRSVHLIEKYVMGLDFEVRGRENLPQDKCFIVASKHESPYETFKLHIILNDPAIILKQELLRIPLWGRFLAKSDPIAIDRKKGLKSLKQIVDGAQRMKEQGRPIVIFPQGTRVYIHETPADKPYKPGVAQIHEATGLPIIPLALNTGVFWPRRSWIKHPGKVVFEFLPAVPDDLDSKGIMKDLEFRLEEKSAALAREAQDKLI